MIKSVIKVFFIIFLVLFSAVVLFISYTLYEIHHEVDETPIVEVPFEPSKTEPIYIKNLKVPRSGYFYFTFFIYRKDKGDIFNDLDYLFDKENMFTLKYRIAANGKTLVEDMTKPYSYKGEIHAIYFPKRFRKNTVLDIVLENQYPNDKLNNFDVVFKIIEVKPGK